jgi:hypothetical protein
MVKELVCLGRRGPGPSRGRRGPVNRWKRRRSWRDLSKRVSDRSDGPHWSASAINHPHLNPSSPQPLISPLRGSAAPLVFVSSSLVFGVVSISVLLPISTGPWFLFSIQDAICSSCICFLLFLLPPSMVCYFLLFWWRNFGNWHPRFEFETWVRYAHVKRPRVLILNTRAPNLGVRQFTPGESHFSERAVLPPPARSACDLPYISLGLLTDFFSELASLRSFGSVMTNDILTPRSWNVDCLYLIF